MADYREPVDGGEMREPKNMDWGPWVSWCKHEAPTELADCRFQAVYINQLGEVMNDSLDGNDRHTNHHIWAASFGDNAITLAYRKEAVAK